MPIYDGGYLERPEDEREGEALWQDSDCGDFPWEPPRTGRPGERPFDHWPEESAGPEWRMFRDMMDDDED